MWRKAAAALILVAGALSIYRVCVVPYICSQTERQVEIRTETAARFAATRGGRELAERNLARLQECFEGDTTNVNLYMLAAANQRVLGHDHDAALLYQQALRYDQRPEIYLNLGVVQAATKDPEGAVRSLVMAGNFSGKEILIDAPDGPTREEAYAIVAANEASLLAKYGKATHRSVILNPTFDKLGPRNPLRVDAGTPQPWPTAAQYWFALGGEPPDVVTEVVPSTRRPGGKMLHVVVPKGTIVFQGLGAQLANAVTEAWIFVRHGKVWVASGNGYGTSPDSYSTAAGRWERLQARNGTCPATDTRIVTVMDSDFYVDSVDVFEIPGPVCGGAR
jgi:hypothetical protein